MNTQKGTLLFLVGIISAGCGSFARNSKQSSIPLPSPQTEYRIVTKNESEDGKSVTIVRLERMLIIDPDVGEPIGFSSMFAYDKKSQEIPAAYISFYSNGPKCRFLSKSDLSFIADGQAVRVSDNSATEKPGDGKLISLSEPGTDGCKESLDALLPQKAYFRIANAQNVEVQFGELRFRLYENHQAALRELGRRMTALKP